MNATGTASATREYLGFSLGADTYVIEIWQVREVLDPVGITKVPKMPPFMLGVINLRGKAIPLVDLRLLLGIEPGERTSHTCIIIIEAMVRGQKVLVGGLADSVNEVFTLGADDIEPPPAAGPQGLGSFLSGMAAREDGFMMILDVDRVFEEGGELLCHAQERTHDGGPE